jgi:hypothetical protein
MGWIFLKTRKDVMKSVKVLSMAGIALSVAACGGSKHSAPVTKLTCAPNAKVSDQKFAVAKFKQVSPSVIEWSENDYIQESGSDYDLDLETGKYETKPYAYSRTAKKKPMKNPTHYRVDLSSKVVTNTDSEDTYSYKATVSASERGTVIYVDQDTIEAETRRVEGNSSDYLAEFCGVESAYLKFTINNDTVTSEEVSTIFLKKSDALKTVEDVAGAVGTVAGEVIATGVEAGFEVVGAAVGAIGNAVAGGLGGCPTDR